MFELSLAGIGLALLWFWLRGSALAAFVMFFVCEWLALEFTAGPPEMAWRYRWVWLAVGLFVAVFPNYLWRCVRLGRIVNDPTRSFWDREWAKEQLDRITGAKSPPLKR